MQIGFFLYQYATLHMLQFHFDVMDKYLDRSDFEYYEMATDSTYMSPHMGKRTLTPIR